MTLTIGSLFSGIGGLELGLERGIGNGARTVWQVEQNAYCRAVLAKHWPDATRYEDVRDVGRANLAPVDVLCGGFPCQDVSNAGRRAGVVAGTRSGLWYEYARIIRELRPAYVVVENVAALLTLGLDAVLGELAESGYDAEWDCLPASSVGAPHQRDRVFVLAYANSEQYESRSSAERWSSASILSLADAAGDRRTECGTGHEGRDADSARRISVRGESRRGGADRSALADAASIGRGSRGAGRLDPGGAWESEQPLRSTESSADSVLPRLEGQREVAGRIGSQQHDAGDHSGWSAEPDVGRVANGVPNRVDRLKALGNAVVPQVAEVVGRLIAEREARQAVAA